MVEQLYNTRILRLASSVPHHVRLVDAEFTLKKVSPICGSRIIVDISLIHGKVSAFGQEVRACALGQASASILGANIIGASTAELAAARDQLAHYLAGTGASPQGRFSELEVFAPAIPHRSRHGSIMLAFQAAAEASAEAAVAIAVAHPV